ncbi:hypothetical protein NFI96_034004, partial [Prochilodus magdalenae]
EEEPYKSVEASQEDTQEDSWTLLGLFSGRFPVKQTCTTIQRETLSLSQSQHSKRLTRMKLSVLLLFLSALALGSAERCKGDSKKFGYINFSTKHILPKGFDVNSQEKWEDYLKNTIFNNKPLCERETPNNLQTFFECSSESEVKKICNGEGYEKAGGDGDLCISENTFKVYMVKIKMENNQCKVDNIKSDNLYVVVDCENVDNQCLPVHFHGQVKKTEPGKPCKP